MCVLTLLHCPGQQSVSLSDFAPLLFVLCRPPYNTAQTNWAVNSLSNSRAWDVFRPAALCGDGSAELLLQPQQSQLSRPPVPPFPLLHGGGVLQVQTESGGQSSISEEHSTISSVSSLSALFQPTLHVSVLLRAIKPAVTHGTAVLGVTPPYKKIKAVPSC